MKKIIVFRHGAYDNNLCLTTESAYRLFIIAKNLMDLVGPPAEIMCSPVKRVQQSAGILNLAFGKVPLVSAKELQDNKSSKIRLFAESFALEAQTKYADTDVLVWVSHQPSIWELTGKDLGFNDWLVLEANQWQNIFDPKQAVLYRPKNFLISCGYNEDDALKKLVSLMEDLPNDEEIKQIQNELQK